LNAISGLDCWLNYWSDLSFILYTTNPGLLLEFKLVEHRDICTLVTFTVSLVQYSHYCRKALTCLYWMIIPNSPSRHAISQVQRGLQYHNGDPRIYSYGSP